MKFGKTTELDDIDFTLPALDQSYQRMLSGYPKKLELRLGATGWGNTAWKGQIYPTKCKADQFLHHYAANFDGIELNTTHYRIPSKDQVKKWAEQTPPSFRFSPKVLQYISHSRDLSLSNLDRITEFCDHMLSFEDRLGTSFMQLPPHFTFDRWPVLEKFLRQWPQEVPLALEFRHGSFFEPSHLDQITDTLLETKTYALITDVAGDRSVLHTRIWGPETMIRFVGNAPHISDQKRIEDWLIYLKILADAGLEKCYLFIHQPDPSAVLHTTESIYHKANQQNLTTAEKKLIRYDANNSLLLFS